MAGRSAFAMTDVDLAEDLLYHYRQHGAAFRIDFTHFAALTDDVRGEFIRFLNFARRHQARDPVYETAYRRFVHLFVLRGSRAHHLAGLDRRLRAAIHNQSALVLISGAAGIGKTSLAMTLQTRATELGAKFIVARCDEQVGPPFWPWHELLRSVAERTIGSLDSLPEVFNEGEEALNPHHLALALADWLRAYTSQQPLVFLLDDLHWADVDSLEVLQRLTGRIADLPILFMATYRAEEAQREHALYRYLPELQRNRQVETLVLHPLTELDTANLVTGYYGDCSPALASYLHRRAEGHPLFTVELLHDLVEQKLLTRNETGQWLPPDQTAPVPTLLQQVILQRVARLEHDAETFLTAAAVVGTSWPLAVVEHVAELPEDRLLEVLEMTLRVDLVRVVDAKREIYQFSHGLIQEVLYEQPLARRRKRMHAVAAAYLEAHMPTDLTGLAYHFYQAENWQKAFEYCVAAGDEAAARFASHSALEFYDQALQAAQRAREAISATVFIGLFERIGNTHIALEQRFEAETAFSHMRAAALREGDKAGLLRALTQLSMVWLSLYQFETGDLYAQAAVKLAEEEELKDPGLLGRLAVNLGRAHYVRGELDRGKPYFEQAIRHARTKGDLVTLSTALRQRTFEAIWRGRYEEAEQSAQAALDAAQQAQDFLSLAGGHQILSHVQIELGKYIEAYNTIATILNESDTAKTHHQLPRLLNNMGYLYLEVGDPAQSLVWDKRALVASRQASRLTNYEMERYSILNIATDLLYLSRLDDAQAMIAEFEGIKDRTEFTNFRYTNRYQLLMAEMSLVRKDVQRAMHFAREAREHAQRYGMRKNVTKSWLYEGQAHADLGHLKEAIVSLEHAVALSDDIQHGSLRWKTRYHLARAYRQANHPNAEILETAMLLVDDVTRQLQGSELGSIFLNAPLVQALKAEEPLSATRGPSKPTYPAGLTHREVEVLRLVAGGATNRQIAQALQISVRTVNTHITNILNKINCDNRTAATAFAIQHKLHRT